MRSLTFLVVAHGLGFRERASVECGSDTEIAGILSQRCGRQQQRCL